jgi:hypothetical protein
MATQAVKTKVANGIAAVLKKNLTDALGTAEITVVVDERTAHVVWEAGPFEWAPCLTMSESIFAGELDEYGTPAEVWQQQIDAICRSHDVYLEADNNYSISVWEA